MISHLGQEMIKFNKNLAVGIFMKEGNFDMLKFDDENGPATHPALWAGGCTPKLAQE